MIKTDRENFSMSNEGINHTVQLEVKDGEYYLTVQFKGLAIYNQFGYLQKLSYYDKGATHTMIMVSHRAQLSQPKSLHSMMLSTDTTIRITFIHSF